MSSLYLLLLVPLACAILSMSLVKLNRFSAALMSTIPLGILLMGEAERVDLSWIPSLNVHFSLLVDGVSRLFLYLTAIIIPIVFLTSSKEEKSQRFFGTVFLLQSLLFGFFLSNDLVLFTLFWEAMLLPLFYLLLVFGGADRQRAAIRFLLYMLAGSCLLVAGVISLYLNAEPHTFALEGLRAQAGTYAPWIFFVFLLAFAVKTPLFPFHAWLPDAYTQASTSGTIILSALLSKAGIYGIYRIGVGLFPQMMLEYSAPLTIVAIVGVLYGGFCALAQDDYKRLVAYSSFSHVNFILAGLFAWNAVAHQGALLQVFNHGITITALFLIVHLVHERIHSGHLSAGGGIASLLPKLSWTALLFVLASIALPGTGNFVGEVLILFGLFGQSGILAALLGLSLILGAAYMLRFQHRLFFGSVNPHMPKSEDLNWAEWLPLMILVFFVLLAGLHPAPLFQWMEVSP
jgi:NADH-quinone oxidoreductase subunit M